MKFDFENKVKDINQCLLFLDNLQTLQVNLGNKCNLSCKNCHVQAGPNGKKIMSTIIMKKIIDFLRNHPGLCLDMTGGCPEMNPDFKFLLERAREIVSRIIVRTNLTVFFEPGLEWIPQWYGRNNVVVVGSLPCYTQENVDAQRGVNVFNRSIEAIKILNDLGYGKEEHLELNLVYNPGGDFLPAPQEQLEADYKKHLYDKFGIVFSKLFTITNAPIGRFKTYLVANGRLKQYLYLLTENFNPAAAENIMCRTLISIDYKGIVYNCDFNQALNLPIIDEMGDFVAIDTLEETLKSNLKIITDSHCFCCTAGAGSSCTGKLI